MRHIITQGGQYDEILDAIEAHEGDGWNPGEVTYGFSVCETCGRWACEAHAAVDPDRAPNVADARNLTGGYWRGVFDDCCECWADDPSFDFDEDITTPSPEAFRRQVEASIDQCAESYAADKTKAQLVREIWRLSTRLDLARDSADMLREMLAEARKALDEARADLDSIKPSAVKVILPV